MGCKLVRGETIYFVRHGGPTSTTGIEAEWFGHEKDSRLLPRVFTHSDGRQVRPRAISSVVPIEVQCFDFS